MTDYKKPMIQVFEKYRHKFEPYSLFERFMEFVISGFDITFSAIERPFSKEESEACMELLGDVYMDYLSGTMKSIGRASISHPCTSASLWRK